MLMLRPRLIINITSLAYSLALLLLLVSSTSHALKYQQIADLSLNVKDHALLQEKGAHIIVIAGQSNIVGEPKAGITKDNSQDPRLSDVYQYGFDSEKLLKVRGSHALDFANIVDQDVQGFWQTFIFRGKALGLFTKPIILVPVAKNGTRFSSSWSPNNLLYRAALHRIKTAVATHPDNDMMAFLWGQGESTALVGGNELSQHGANLHTLYRSLQQSSVITSTTPFVTFSVHPDTFSTINASAHQRVARVNNAIATFTQQHAMVARVDLSDLTLSDNIHLDAESVQIMGERFADVLATLLPLK